MNKKKQKGYAILFTVVIVSIISLLVIGLSNTTFKQLILSVGARDSQIALFQSDMATECAFFADLNEIVDDTSIDCGVDDLGGPYTLDINKIVNGNITTYNLNPENESSSDPCFRISLIYEDVAGGRNTTINASGYNICDKSNPRTVERTIQVKY